MNQIKYKNKTWVLSVSRNMSFFHVCMSVASCAKDNYSLKVSKKRELCIAHDGVFAEAYFCQSDLSKYYKAIEKICSHRELLKNLEKSYQVLGGNLLKAGKNLEKNITLTTYNNFVKHYTFLCAGLSLTAIFGRHIHSLLLIELKKYFPQQSHQEIEKLIGQITYPPQHTPLSDSQIKLLQTAIYIQKQKIKPKDIVKNKEVSKKIAGFLEQYKAVPVNFNGEAWTERDIYQQLRQLLRSNCPQTLKLIQENHLKRINEAQRLLSKVKRKLIKDYTLALQSATILNEYRKYVFCQASLNYRPLFFKIASRFGLRDWRQLWKLSSDEVRDLYFFNKVRVLEKLKDRKIVAVVSDEKDGYRILTNKELSDLSIDGVKNASANTVFMRKFAQGTIGNSGFVQATARIIFTAKDFRKFKVGDVLITRMTSVDFIPLMVQASAFVTDEGGITSHAAIVSREMNKPCVIGTKIATKVFKDGDLVEVDANKGIVRLIKNIK